MTAPGPIVSLLRHGETEWSKSGRHTGRTDIPLTPTGEAQAKELGTIIAPGAFSSVWVSPMQRARRTAVLAGLADFEVVDDLREWDYGELDGMTTEQIREEFPGWTVWEGPWRGGETGDDVAARADRVIERILAQPPAARVALVGHGHFSRVLGARWIGAPVSAGGWLALDTAAACELGWEHGRRVLHRWNLVAGATIGG